MELDFSQKIEAIKQDPQKTFVVTPWEIANHFHYQRRSWGLAERVNKFLDANDVELSGDFYQAWFYEKLLLQHKTIAKTKIATDPIKRVNSLAAANHKPLFVDRNDSLSHAITVMQQYDYSQLPVVSGGERNICGYISWKTIGLGLWFNRQGNNVGDYMEKDIVVVPRNTPLLVAIRIIAEKEFVVVINDDKTFSGIITASDIAAEFFSITQAEAFLLLEQIELQIRILIGRAGLLVADLQKICREPGRVVESIDDLTFGEYRAIMQDPKNWGKMHIKNDRSDFDKFMAEINQIRNDVMHFEPDGIGAEKMRNLRNMARYLTEIANMA